MTILILTQFFFPDSMGGAGRYARDLARSLRDRRHQVVVLTAWKEGLPHEETVDGIRLIRYGPLRRWWHLPGTLHAIRWTFRRLHQEQPFDLIAIQQPLPAWALLPDRRACRVPWVYHFHSPWAEESRILLGRTAWDLRQLAGSWVRRRMERRIVRRAARCVTLSESMKALLAATHGVGPDRLEVVPGCVDLDRFQPAADRAALRRQLGLPPGQPVLLTVRNLVPRQNLDGLIRAARRLADAGRAALLLIGSTGPLADSLRELAKSLGLEGQVRFLGRVPDEQLPSWYQAADLFVMPSKALEGFGLATLEALACGTPVVGTPIGGTHELLARLDASLLCDNATPEALASAVSRTLRRLDEPRARDALQRRCREFAAPFGRPAMGERIEGVYRQACRPKVLHIHTLPVISGSGLNTFLSMRGQREAGYEVELACAPGGSLIDLVERHGMTVRRLQHIRWSIHPAQDALVIAELARLMRQQGYAIVHTHNSKAGFVGRLAARLAGVPVIVHTVHGFAFHDRAPRWKRWVYRTAERLASPWCDQLIMISQPLIEWAVRERIAPRERMVKIYSGIDVGAFRHGDDRDGLRRSMGASPGDFLVGEVAKLWEGKGHDTLLQAAAALAPRLPTLRVVLIGDGALRLRLERMAQTLGIAGRVHFTGFRDDVPALTQALDVAVLPSLFEGMGRAVLEAQAAGVPVIASRVGGIPELIEDGVTGLLIPPGDGRALAQGLQRLYDDADLRRRLAEAARRQVDGRFDAHTMVKQINGVYAALLTRRRGAGCAR